MPLLSSSYCPPWWLRNGHIQSIWPSLFRKVSIAMVRTRIETPDGDFLDLDLARVGSTRAVIIGHGLEGNSERAYVRGMARAFNDAGWDAVAWNYRGCSGEPNRRLRSYHSGATEDLDVVIDFASKSYATIGLVGFSLGGNLVLKYLGERRIEKPICGGVAISTPCDLKASALRMSSRSNRIYMARFLRMLGEKLAIKSSRFPGQIDLSGYKAIKTFQEFDDRYTAPMHGFKDAEDYWRRCSSLTMVESIGLPTLILSSVDDPFLTEECFPREAAVRNENIYLELTQAGGHVGFMQFGHGGRYYSESRAVEFLDTVVHSGSGR